MMESCRFVFKNHSSLEYFPKALVRIIPPKMDLRFLNTFLETTSMAVWSKALPLTASSLSPLPGFEFRPGHVRKLSVTWA